MYTSWECRKVSSCVQMPHYMKDLNYLQFQLYKLSSSHLIGYDLLMFSWKYLWDAKIEVCFQLRDHISPTYNTYWMVKNIIVLSWRVRTLLATKQLVLFITIWFFSLYHVSIVFFSHNLNPFCSQPESNNNAIWFSIMSSTYLIEFSFHR